MNLIYWKNGIGKKYNEISLPMKTVFWFTVCGFLQKAFGMLTTPVFTRVMSTEEYGEYSVFVSVTTILTVIATFNITSVIVTKGINKYYEKQEQFIANIQVLSSVSVLISAVIFFSIQEWFCQITGLSITIMCFAWGEIFVMPAFGIWSAKQRYDCNYKKILLFTVVYLVLNTVLVIGVVVFSKNKGEARIISSCVVLIIMYGLLYLSNMQWKRGVFSTEMIKFALRFNLPLIPQGLANQVLSRSDILMIQYFQGAAQSGIYSLGYSVAMIVIILTVSINDVYVPWLYKKLANKEWGAIKEKSIYMLEVVFTVITGMILTAPEIVRIFAPGEYKEAVYVIAPVAVGIAFTIVDTLFVYIELYFEKTLIVMLGSIFVAVLNIVLNAYFIPRFGFIAAAYTTLASYIGYTIIHFLCVLKFCRKEIFIFEIYNIKKILALCVLQIIALLIIVWMYPYSRLRHMIAVAGCACVGLVLIKRKALNVG